MRVFHTEIIDNTVSYIAKRYQDFYDEPINQMRMYKILALFDFECVKEIGRPCTELTYLALKKGPVPNELYNEDESKYKAFSSKKITINDNVYKYYYSTKEPDLEYFSDKELRILNKNINYFLTNAVSSDEASELTHKQIKAWAKTWNKNPNSKINYADEFNDIYTKSEDELSLQEEYFLMYNRNSKCQNIK